MIVEVCANSFDSAHHAQAGGADRVELCAELAVGGVTPSAGVIEKCVRELKIPVHVLIRPRSGNFIYSSTEFDAMKRDVEFCKAIGCAGVVSGILMEGFRVDVDRTAQLVRAARPMAFTFHRAFDWLQDPITALKQLEELGVERILTSGQAKSAEQGLDRLVHWQEQYSGTLLAGGGIGLHNAMQFWKAGLKEIHLSATRGRPTHQPAPLSFFSSKHADENMLYVTDPQVIEQIKQLLHA